jgi:succinoglycan biosynthesis protein ExoO
MFISDCDVSVVIPLYNSAATIERAAESALRQSLRDIEIIIVDDASPDTSLSEARALAAADSRLRVIALKENRGKSHAMNRAISEARGKWIAVLDADDWYEPDRLAVLIAAGEAHGADMVADNQRFWDAGAGQPVRTAFPIERGSVPITRPSFISGSDPFADFDFGMLKPLVRADCIHRIGLRYREGARLSEDFLYLADFFASGRSGYLVAEPLYNWTQPFGAISRRWTETGSGTWRYDYRSAIASHGEALRDMRDADLARLLTTRIQAFTRLDHLARLGRMRECGARLLDLALEAARHPSIWPLLASRSWRAWFGNDSAGSVRTAGGR